jgi:hypothetical protein
MRQRTPDRLLNATPAAPDLTHKTLERRHGYIPIF